MIPCNVVGRIVHAIFSTIAHNTVDVMCAMMSDLNTSLGHIGPGIMVNIMTHSVYQSA